MVETVRFWQFLPVSGLSKIVKACPGSSPAQSICYRKVEIYQHVINSLPPVLTTGSTKAVHVHSCLRDNACKRSLAICHKSRASCSVHVLLCLCYDACKRSLAICRKSRASCPVSRLLSIPIWPACAKQGRKYDSINNNRGWTWRMHSSRKLILVGKFTIITFQ